MNWLKSHWRACIDAALKIKSSPLSFVFNAIVVALALTLPMMGMVVMQDLQPISGQLTVDPEISIFLSADLPREKAESMAADFRHLASQQHVTCTLKFVPRETALNNLKMQAELSDVVSTLGSNPLPDAYIMKLTNGSGEDRLKHVEDLAASIQKMDGVQTVQLDTLWLKRLAAVLTLASHLFWIVAGTLCGVVVAVVFNTIRLQLLTHAEEINVTRLLGATDAFVARPFYYFGALLGLVSASLALILVLSGLHLINQPVSALAQSYGTSFQLSNPDPGSVVFLMIIGIMLGFFGATLSVWRSLRRSL